MKTTLEAEFDLAIATFEAGQQSKGLKMLRSLAKKGFSPAIWEMFTLSVNSGDLRGARKWLRQEKDPAMLAMLEAVLAEAESGTDVALYKKAYEYGHAGAAYHLAKYFSAIGDSKEAEDWVSRAAAMGMLAEDLIEELRELLPAKNVKNLGQNPEDNQVVKEREIGEGIYENTWEDSMKWDDWVERYKPIKNHLTKYPDPQSDYEPFETYGEEWEFIKSQDPKYVWTEVQLDMSSWLLPGVYLDDRLSAFICEVPWETGDQPVLVSVDIECDYCEGESGEGDPDCKECEGSGLRTVDPRDLH